MSFWEGMRRGDERGIATMGEDVWFAGVKYRGVVSDLVQNPELAPGGAMAGTRFRVQVDRETRGIIQDGDTAEVRGVAGRVDFFEDVGGSWFVFVGDRSRWNGDIPGL